MSFFLKFRTNSVFFQKHPADIWKNTFFLVFCDGVWIWVMELVELEAGYTLHGCTIQNSVQLGKKSECFYRHSAHIWQNAFLPYSCDGVWLWVMELVEPEASCIFHIQTVGVFSKLQGVIEVKWVQSCHMFWAVSPERSTVERWRKHINRSWGGGLSAHTGFVLAGFTVRAAHPPSVCTANGNRNRIRSRDRSGRASAR